MKKDYFSPPAFGEDLSLNSRGKIDLSLWRSLFLIKGMFRVNCPSKGGFGLGYAEPLSQ